MMKSIGLFYGSGTVRTSKLAKKIQVAFGESEVGLVPVETAWIDDFNSYTYIILGCSTWFDGELPDYWAELVPALEDMNMEGKKVAIFGLGDQVKYDENFADGVGLLAHLFESLGAQLCGFTSPEGYEYTRSAAYRDGKFLGLVIDVENQSEKTKGRVEEWVKQLKQEFN